MKTLASTQRQPRLARQLVNIISLLLLIALLGAAAFAAVKVPPATGAAVPAFALPPKSAIGLRYSATARGDIAIAGNTLMTCSERISGCGDARSGAAAGALANNQYYVMEYVDVDQDPATANSSRAALDIPAGAAVLWAGLYWAAPALSSREPIAQVLLAPPGAAYQALTGSLAAAPNGAFAYQGFANVTALVQAHGAGVYTVGNVQARNQIRNGWAGWSLVVAYADAAQPIRNLAVFDGLTQIHAADAPSVSATLFGLAAPAGSAHTAKLGFVAYDGDRSSTSESLTVNGAPVSDSLRPADNLFAGEISALGSRIVAKEPNFVNQLGLDIAMLDIRAALSDARQARLTFAAGASGGDNENYYLGVVTMAVDRALATEPPPVNLLGNPSFEQQTAGWWCNHCSLQTTRTNPYTPTTALLVNKRSAAWAGPNQNVTGIIENGATYLTSAWVRLPAGSGMAKLSLSVRNAAGKQRWLFSAVTPVGQGWQQLRAAWAPQWDGQIAEALWYVEVAGANGSSPDFVVDETSLTRAPAPAPVSLLQNGGFDSATDGWTCRFQTCRLEVVGRDGPHANVLRVSNRTAGWAGPVQFVTPSLRSGQPYSSAVNLRLADGAAASTVYLNLYLREQSGREQYHRVSEAAVTSGWTTLAGAVVPVWKGNLAEAYWYLETPSNNPHPTLLIDNATLRPIPARAGAGPRPAAPINLQVAAVDQTTATLVWQPGAGSAGLAGYGLEYEAAGLLVGSTAGGSMRLTGLRPNTSYALALRAFDGAGQSSEPVTVVVNTAP